MERRDLLAVDIVFDYSYDDSGFFDTDAKAALERAATDYETRLLDTLTAIPAPTAGNSWTASFQDPETGSTVNLQNLQLAENEVRVFVGSRNLTGSTLGKASAGYGVQYTDPNWVDTVLWRGQSGANEQSTWGGSIAFDTSPTWHFDVGLPTSGTTDFYSVALHELGHIFGISNQPGNTWTSLTKSLSELSTADQALVDNEPGDYFTGPKSVALYGSPIPVDGGHFEHDVSYAGAEAALDPSLTTGTRKPMSPLDWTTLDDIGWDIGTRFLSGTVFDDSVIDNDQPDAGEGEAGITVTATNNTTSTEYTTTTHTDGTYALELPPGTYDVTFTRHVGSATFESLSVSSSNVAFDLVTSDANWGLELGTPSNLVLTVVSPTEATLNWSDTIGETGYRVYGWNSLSGTTLLETLPADTVTYNAAGLPQGLRQWFYVQAFNEFESARTDWKLVVMPSAETVPTVPGNFILTAMSSTSAQLQWEDSESETSYEIYRWTAATGTVLLATIPANSTSYLATGLTPGGREQFHVRPINGDKSARTDWKLVVMPSAETVPTIPGNFTLTAMSSTSAQLQWEDSESETSYEIYRWTAATGTVLLATIPANSTSYLATGLTPGGREQFHVRPINGDKSARTDWKLVVMPSAETVPTVPGNFTLTAMSSTSAQLQWEDSESETSYEIYRWTAATGTVLLATIPANSTSYLATGLTPGGREQFHVRPINGDKSARTDWKLVVMPSAETVPTVPGNFTLTAMSSTSAQLQWEDSESETSYEIYRWTAATGTVLLATIPADSTSYLATGLTPGSREQFHVRPINGDKSARTDWKLVVMPSAETVPTVPGNFTLTAMSSTSAQLQWEDSESETSYEIYRWTAATGTVLLATIPANSTSYLATGLTPGGREQFHVKAVNGTESARTEWQILTMPLT
ncbi:fibronectin type III domain-containing protein [Rosistilla oblonga]|uniref:fibronectin type III domain-containing protein n=1 Tax=Rosistilla oblonga TaxID=2527990 RepID=UPI0018D238A0|nr:fibronectin type III domain-containing protein [Rosistilla oblonga]